MIPGTIIFPENPRLSVDDLITWVDEDEGQTHRLPGEIQRGASELGSVWAVRVEEQINNACDPVKFYGDNFKRILAAELKARVIACVIAIANRAKKLLSVPGTGQRIRATKKHRKKSTVYGFAPSAPGEPPRKQSGRLRGSVASEVQDVMGVPVGRAGTNVKYGRVLEGGAEEMRNKAWGKPTKPYRWRLLARPWLTAGL